MHNHQLAPAKYHFCDSRNERLMFRSETKIVEKIHCAVQLSPVFKRELATLAALLNPYFCRDTSLYLLGHSFSQNPFFPTLLKALLNK